MYTARLLLEKNVGVPSNTEAVVFWSTGETKTNDRFLSKLTGEFGTGSNRYRVTYIPGVTCVFRGDGALCSFACCQDAREKYTCALARLFALGWQAMLKLSKEYNQRVQEEEGKTVDELAVLNVGKVDPKRHLENDVSELMAANIVQSLGAMLDTVIF